MLAVAGATLAVQAGEAAVVASRQVVAEDRLLALTVVKRVIDPLTAINHARPELATTVAKKATCLETAPPLDQVVKAVASHLEATVPATLVVRPAT